LDEYAFLRRVPGNTGGHHEIAHTFGRLRAGRHHRLRGARILRRAIVRRRAEIVRRDGRLRAREQQSAGADGPQSHLHDRPERAHAEQDLPGGEYQGNTTWAYSYIDNRVSLAFVTYGPSGNVVRNVEMKGTRYVWQMVSNTANSTVTATGQGNSTVSAPWSQLGQ
jgi:hypothetical protein